MEESSIAGTIPQEEDYDDDYMSDLSKFIPKQSSKPSKTPQKNRLIPPNPTLKKPKSQLNRHTQKRLEKERKQLQEDQTTLQNLTSSIPESNIGFKMLKQMGYTPGSGIGKSGRVEPVGVEIRRSRAGIGGEDPAKMRLREEMERVEREKAKVVREEKGVEEMVEEFGVRQRVLWRSKRVLWSFRKAKAVIDQLENREVVVVLDDKEEEEENEEEEVITEENRGSQDSKLARISAALHDYQYEFEKDLLEILVKLREEHRYCLFCGCQYESAEALLDNCPGITEDDH